MVVDSSNNLETGEGTVALECRQLGTDEATEQRSRDLGGTGSTSLVREIEHRIMYGMAEFNDSVRLLNESSSTFSQQGLNVKVAAKARP